MDYFSLLLKHNSALRWNCAGFNQVAKYCTQEEFCHRCGAKQPPHQSTEENLKCPKCVEMKFSKSRQSVTDFPVYQPKLTFFEVLIIVIKILG